MAAGNGMNMAVGLDLSQLQKDLKTLDKNLNSVVGQEKVIKIKAILEDEGKAMKGFESLHKAITELSDARANLKIDGNLVNDMSIKEAQKSLRQFRKELKDINSGKIADPSGQRATQLMANITNVGRWVNATKASAKELANIGWVDVNRQAAKAKAARSAITKEMNRLRAEMDKLGNVSPADLKARESYLKRLITLQEQYNKTYARSTKKGTQALSDLQNELQMTRYLRDNNKLFDDRGRMLGKLRTLASRYVSIFTIGHLARKVAETTGFFERQQVALEGIVGSATKAAEIMGQIKSFAPNSPFQTKQLIEYTKQLAAYNIAVDDLFPKTKMLADLSAGLGVDMQRLILAYGQVNAASVLRGQELRQFTEAGIPMVQKLADKFSELNGRIVTTGEVFELISKRQVSFDMVSQVLTDMTSAGGKFYNMQANLMGTVYGQIEKLKDLWTLSLDTIGKSSHKTITRILSWMQAAVKNATSLLRGLTVTIALNTLGSIWTRLKQLRTEIGLIGMAAKGAWGAISLGAGVAIAVFKKVWEENHRIEKQFAEIHKSFEKQTRNAIKGLDELKDKLHEADKGTKSYQEALDALSSNYSQYIGDVNTFVQSLSDEADAFGSLEIAIKKYNEALEKKQQLEQTRTTIGEAFEFKEWQGEGLKNFLYPGNTNWFGVKAGFKKQYGIDYEAANDMFKDVIGNILKTMSDKNLLSIDEDIKTRAKENKDIFLSLLPDAMRRGGLGNVLLNFSQEGIEELWKHFNNTSLEDNDSRRAYAKYRELRREQMGYGSSDFAWISRIENTFDGLPSKLKTELQAATPEQYSREYNAKWIEAALGYIGNKNGDFAKLGKEDENGVFKQYAKAEYDKLIAVMGRETKRDQNGNLIGFDEASVYNVENAFKEYHKALAVVDKEGAAVLQHLMKIFSDGTDEASGRAAAVRETIFKIWANDAEGMKIARQYLPKDSDFSDIRGKLPQKQMDVLTKLGEYGITLDPNVPVKKYKERNRSTHSAEANAEIDNLLKEYEVVTRLMEATQKGITISVHGPGGKPLEAQLFDISSREKNFTGGGGNNREFPDFFNIFKNAYDQYKRAAQQGGVANAVNEFRSNPTLRSQYGDMFGIEGSIKEFGFKIGDKTVAQIIEDNLIKGGLEDGVVDFKKAAQETAKTLLDYGRANEKERGAFIRLGEQIQKWVTETFTKDTITTWLDEFGKSVQNLTISFDNMHKNVELARKMSAQGTLGYLGQVTGVSDIDIYKPKSAEQRENISSLVAAYNDWAANVSGANGEKLTAFKLKDISTLKGIEDQIKSLNEQLDVNKEAFKALPQGEIFVKNLISALQSLDKTIREEVGSISGKKFETNLSDAIFNSMVDRNKVVDELITQLGIDKSHIGKESPEDYEKYIKAIETITKQVYDRFNKESGANPVRMTKNGSVFGLRPYDIAAMQKKYDEATKNINSPAMRGQMDELWYDLKEKMEAFNASIGEGYFGYLQQFLHPEVEAAKRYKELDDESTALRERKIELEQIPLDERSQGETRELADIMARLVAIEERKTAMGENGANEIPTIRQNAGKNLEATPQQWSDSLNKTKSAAESLIASVKSLIDGFSKFYDMLNDGENPAALKDIEGFIEDFQGDFEALVAPITAVMGLIIALTAVITVLGTTAGIVFGALIAAALIVAALFAVFQMHDRRLERSIEGLKEDVEAFDNAITNLQAAAERSVGFEKLRKNIEATGKELEKATAYAEMARLEEEKKNTDDDKVKEYKQSYQEAMDSFLNGMREVRNELVSSTEDWANAMGSAIRSAFQNGENAARAFRNTVKTMMGDVIEKMLEMAILQPLMESVLENWTNSNYLRQKYTKEWVEKDENGKEIKRSELQNKEFMEEILKRITDPELAEDAYNAMTMIGDLMIDTVNGLPSFWKDAYMHNSELGTLSGGIESVTEDTARRIEALENSQLGEVFAIRTLLEQYLGSTGGFGDSTMASVQAAVVSIASDTSLIRIATDAILNQLNELRTSPARPLHVTMA